MMRSVLRTLPIVSCIAVLLAASPLAHALPVVNIDFFANAATNPLPSNAPSTNSHRYLLRRPPRPERLQLRLRRHPRRDRPPTPPIRAATPSRAQAASAPTTPSTTASSTSPASSISRPEPTTSSTTAPSTSPTTGSGLLINSSDPHLRNHHLILHHRPGHRQRLRHRPVCRHRHYRHHPRTRQLRPPRLRPAHASRRNPPPDRISRTTPFD